MIADNLSISGQKIPRIGVNTRRLSSVKCQQRLSDALAAGIRCIDTAQSYGNEREIGQAIRDSSIDRDNLFIITKVNLTDYKPYDLLWSVRESLDRLRVDYVDLLLLDGINPNIGLERTVGALEEAKRRSLTKSVGLAHFAPKEIDAVNLVAETPMKFIECEYHPFIDRREDLQRVQEQDGALFASSPFAMGAARLSTTVYEIAEAYGKSATQVSMRWLMQQDNVCALARPASFSEMKIMQDVFDFELSAEDMTRIDALRAENLSLQVYSEASAGNHRKLQA